MEWNLGWLQFNMEEPGNFPDPEDSPPGAKDKTPGEK